MTGIVAELEAAGATIKYSIDGAHLRQTLQVSAAPCCINAQMLYLHVYEILGASKIGGRRPALVLTQLLIRLTCRLS